VSIDKQTRDNVCYTRHKILDSPYLRLKKTRPLALQSACFLCISFLCNFAEPLDCLLKADNTQLASGALESPTQIRTVDCSHYIYIYFDSDISTYITQLTHFPLCLTSNRSRCLLSLQGFKEVHTLHIHVKHHRTHSNQSTQPPTLLTIRRALTAVKATTACIATVPCTLYRPPADSRTNNPPLFRSAIGALLTSYSTAAR
jgi:hypothetical protein